MALIIQDTAVERLAEEVARLAGETTTEAIRRALEERRARLTLQPDPCRLARVREFLEREIWPQVPRDQRGRRLTRKQQDALLGFGPDGV